jgi:uncharacterized Zn finger protein
MSVFTERKARRLLAEDRVTLRCLDGELVAEVRGDHDRYRVETGPRGPRCSCPSWRRPCSHEVAVSLVVGEIR